MTEQEQRAAVVREALSWERTPFVWGACVKGVGVDCGHFLGAVLQNCGVIQIDLKAIKQPPPLWFAHGGDFSFLELIRTYATEYELAPGQKPQPGDIVAAQFGKDYAHSAFVLEWPSVIGAAYEHCVTVWRDLNRSPQYMNRRLKFFNPFGTAR